MVIFLALVAGAWGVVRWYVDNSYYVGLDHGHVTIYQGRVGGFLWFHPKVARSTTIPTTHVPQDRLKAVRSGVEESSLAGAERYVSNLRLEWADAQADAQASSGSTTTSGTGSSSKGTG
jgi:protein phosphatase